MTEAQLAEIAVFARRDRVATLWPHVQAALTFAQVNTPLREAMFATQIVHETDYFRSFAEPGYGAGKQRDIAINPVLAKKFGNTEPGDGRKYKGRGALRLTGRFAYKACGEALGVELISNPDIVESNEWAFKAAGWFWRSKHMNQYADKGDVVACTRAINGDLDGIDDREALYARARSILGVKGG